MTKVRTNLGKVATTPKGEYNNATTYLRLDVVTYNGSSYVCLQESVGNLPTNTTYWQLMASKGDTGARGQDGYTPVKGTDYFTQEDIASLNIPEYTSDLVNDSSFIDNTVNNLINYYLKNETYTKTEVNTLIGNIQQFHYEVVQTLPQTGETNILYLVPKSTSETNNYYDEYVYSNGWEKIGDTQVDLSNYVTITMLNQALADYTTTANLTTLLNAKQNQITSTNKLDASLVDDTNSNNKFVTNAEKTTWNGKQDTLTAGTNITIDANNVISASGGNCVYLGNASDYTQQNPLDLDELPLGIYLLGIENFSIDNNYRFYIKYTYNDTPIVASVFRDMSGYVPMVKFITFNYNRKNETAPFYLGTFTYLGIKERLEVYLYEGSIQVANNTINTNTGTYYQIKCVNTNTAQDITSLKTFYTIPQQNDTTAPTNNKEFTNKKYVDDQISNAVGNINTILASLTTPSGNGGN